MKDKETYHILESEKDYPDTIVNGRIPYNLYLYWLDDSLQGANYINSIPFSISTSLISCQFAPYLEASDLHLIKVPFDKNKFGYVGSGTPYVYRINVFEEFFNGGLRDHPGTIEKNLGSFKAYKPQKNIGGARSWRNESKLYNFPFSFAYLYDGLSEPIEIKYEDCKQNDNNVKCRIALNVNSDYSIYIENYRNDTNGEMEQNVISSSRDYPCSSSQYSSWLATNKNTIQASKTNAILSTITNIGAGAVAGATVGTIVPGAGNLVGGGVGAMVGVTKSIIEGVSNLAQQNNNLMAQEKDMRNVPPSLISRGSDLTLGINTTQQKLKLYRYRQKDEYMQKIGDFFAMYGYKQNKLMSINTKDRFYYNFIKTLGCNIETTNKIPLDFLDTIKNIFDKGVTIWHVDRVGVTINDYSKDNYEV